jgi:hypothetical protein
MGITLSEAILTAGACGFAGWYANDSLAALAIFVVLAGLKLVSTHDRLYVLAAGFTFHWSQTVLGLLYKWTVGREVPAFNASDYRPMVYIGLGCCMAMAIGIGIGLRLLKRPDPSEDRPEYALGFPLLIAAYMLMTSFEGTLTAIAADYPSTRQIIVTADSTRLGMLFLLYRRFLRPQPRWTLVGGLLIFEILLGFTGFFAGFREPIVLAAIAILEIFDSRSPRQWLALSTAAVVAVCLGLLWMAIRVDFRRDYLNLDNFEISRSAKFRNFESLAANYLHSDMDTIWYSADQLVERMWTVYYPALAVERVPSQLPHLRQRKGP